MRATKDLVALNDEIVIDVTNEDFSMGATLQYGVGGLGTLVLEMSAGTNAAGVDEWSGPLKLFDPSAAVNAEVDNIAAAGVVTCDNIRGATKIRVRKSVAGAGAVRATLTVKP